MTEPNGPMAQQAKRLTRIVERLQKHKAGVWSSDDRDLIVGCIKYYAAAMLGGEIVTKADGERIVREQEAAGD